MNTKNLRPSELFVWLTIIGLSLIGATHRPNPAAQSFDFRISNLERQMDQMRARLDQIEQTIMFQRSEANRPTITAETGRLIALEKQQELITGRLALLEKTWQTTESTVEQLMKERLKAPPARDDKTKKEETDRGQAPPAKSKDRPPKGGG